jgi:signal transduction histidine kinase
MCIVSDVCTDRRFTRFRDTAGNIGFNSFICIPLIPADKPIGVLSLYFADARLLHKAECGLLYTASRTAAIALQRAILDERLLKEEVSKRALEEVSHLKTEFVSLVSHELRTPLTSIQGFVSLIREGHTGELNPLQTEFLGIVSRNSDRLVSIVSDLLDMSKIESGRLELVSESLNLREIVEKEVESFGTMAEEKHITVNVEMDSGLPPVRADRHRLGQIIVNLLSNAVKYSPDNSTVKIRASQSGKQVTVKVIDSGSGIDPEDRSRLFERFYRGKSDAVRGTKGTGLGLAITRYLVEMHGGKIWVESERGQGSTFCFSIPVSTHEIGQSP